MNDTLSDLTKVKAIFQQRAICAALGIMGGASQEGGITHERGATLQPSPANIKE
jgi:hypothetical protein